MLAGKAGAYSSEAPFRCFTLELAPEPGDLALPANIRLGLKGWPKHYTFIIYVYYYTYVIIV